VLLLALVPVACTEEQSRSIYFDNVTFTLDKTRKGGGGKERERAGERKSKEKRK
jgi:hypothetical protein